MLCSHVQICQSLTSARWWHSYGCHAYLQACSLYYYVTLDSIYAFKRVIGSTHIWICNVASITYVIETSRAHDLAMQSHKQDSIFSLEGRNSLNQTKRPQPNPISCQQSNQYDKLQTVLIQSIPCPYMSAKKTRYDFCGKYQFNIFQ